MKFGLRLLTIGSDLRQVVRLAERAERAGFDQVWLPYDPFMESVQALAVVIAERTSRIGVGVMVSPYSTDPSDLASYAATLDLLSEGRALISIGFHTTDMCRWTGHDSSDAVPRTRQSVELVRTLLRGENAACDGPIYHWTDDCYLRFDPLRPNIPIYVAAFGDELLELSGTIGDGSFPRLLPPQAASTVVPPIQQGARNAGRRLEDVDIAGCVWVSTSAVKADAAASLRPMVSYFGPYLEDDILAPIGLTTHDFDPIRLLHAKRQPEAAAAAVTDQMLRLAIVGTPADVIEQFDALARVGVTQINIGGPLGPDPDEAIDLIGTHVIPRFAERAGTSS